MHASINGLHQEAPAQATSKHPRAPYHFTLSPPNPCLWTLLWTLLQSIRRCSHPRNPHTPDPLMHRSPDP